MVNLLIGATGSVASIKLPILINSLQECFKGLNMKLEIKVIVTERATHFFNMKDIPNTVPVLTDKNEWEMWSDRGDPVLHVELGKWADIFVIAPLDANTMAKISNGICDNLLTCTARAWETTKPLLLCPAMNTKMYNHPITEKQLKELNSFGYEIIDVVSKVLMCGDVGLGAMAEVPTIVEYIKLKVLK